MNLEEALRGLKRSHYNCDDGWYSCPKSEEGCANFDMPKDQCTCGADVHNAEVDRVTVAIVAKLEAAQRMSQVVRNTIPTMMPDHFMRTHLQEALAAFDKEQQ